MKKLRIIGGILLSVALLVSSGGAVLADSGEAPVAPEAAAQGEQQYQGLFGTGTIDGDVVTLETKNLGTVEVALVDGQTLYKVPGHEEASKGDIDGESRLAILATPDGDGSYTAVRVMVVPDAATRQHINGVIVSIEDKLMTIINAAGDTLTDIELPEGVKGGVVGDFVSVAVRQSSGQGNPEASGLQTAAEVQARIQTHLNAAAGSGAGTQMEQLSERLVALALRIEEVLQGVLAELPTEVPEEARGSIEDAIVKAEQRIGRAHEAINQARGAAGGQ